MKWSSIRVVDQAATETPDSSSVVSQDENLTVPAMVTQVEGDAKS